MLLKIRQARAYDVDVVSEQAIRKAGADCGFRVLSATPSTVVFKITMGRWSWGEIMEVLISPSPSGCIVDVGSRSVLSSAIVDGGKNEQNIQALFDALDRAIGQDVRWRLVRLCARCGCALLDCDCLACSECGATAFVETIRPSWRARLIASLRNVAMFTGVEYVVILLLKCLGLHSFVPWVFSHPVYGLLSLAIFNAILVATVVIWGRGRRNIITDRASERDYLCHAGQAPKKGELEQKA